jgi:ankyrin repeat protein
VRQLIKDGADPDRAFPGDGSALIAAARRNRVEIIKLLLDAGADVDKGVPGDGNALIAAAQHGSVDAARTLVGKGADVDAYVPGDETPLIAAAANGELAIVKLLVEHHADVNRAYRVMGRLRSPLGMAQSRGYDDIAAYLRAHGAVADPKAANEKAAN